MNPLKTLWQKTGLFQSKKTTELGSLRDIGWTDLSMPADYKQYKANDYENAFGNVTKIMQGFAAIEPYAIDERGEEVEKNLVLDKIYSPNQDMSAYDFREALMLMFLIHDESYIRVHYRGTRLTPNTIEGFTFLEGKTPAVIDGKKTFYLKEGGSITSDEVLTLNSINPYNLSKGFAAGHASRRWTRLDDYIADYQAGFFRNGAIPAGMFIIRAKSLDDYRDIKKRLEDRHKGAGANNNVTYSYQPVSSSGDEQKPQIEWISFSTQNRDLALKDLLEGVNQKVDSAFGVPEEIRGHLRNSNFASVKVAEKVFNKYTLYPLALKVWDKLTHELNRVTGGMGVAISFDLEIPQIEDEIKLAAEAKKVHAETITLMMESGFKLPSIVEAFGFPEDYKDLKREPITPPKKDKPEVDEGGEVENSPRSKKMETKQLTPSDKDRFQKELETVIKNRLNEHIERVIENIPIAKVTPNTASKVLGDPNDDDDELLALEMMAVLLALVYIHGRTSQAHGLALIIEGGLSTSGVKPFKLTPSQQRLYRTYLQKVGGGFNQGTAEAIRGTLARGIEEGWSRQQLISGLRGLIDDDYRIRRLAVSEVGRAEGWGSVFSMENIQQQTGYEIAKIWRTTSGNPCPICEELDGTQVGVAEPFWSVGDTLTGSDGKEYTNNFIDAETPDGHPFCQCIVEYEVTG